ncbi:MAG: hypothetical protein AAFP19_08995 [Bacteroidota bacterium]
MRRIKKMVNTPFFTQKKNPKILFQFIDQFAPDFNAEALTDINAFRYVFPDEKHKQEKLNKVRHNLYQLILQYIYYQYYIQDNLINNIAILNYAEDNGLVKVLKYHLNDVGKKQESLVLKSNNHFYLEYFLQQIRSRLTIIEEKGDGDIHLEEVSAALDKFYILNKLILLSAQLMREKVFDKRMYNYMFKKEFLKNIAESKYLEVPIFNLWYHTFLLVQDKDNYQYYKKVRELLEEQITQLPKIDIRNICGCLQNLARNFFPREDFFKEHFFLHRLQIDNGVFNYANSSYLTPSIFYNIVKVSLLLNETKWLEREFFPSHSYKYMSFDNNIYALCQAEIAFHRQEFKEASDLLLKYHSGEYKINHIFINFAKNRLLLKLYYETNSPLFKATIQANRTSITREKMKSRDEPGHQLFAHRSFVNLINKLYLLREKRNLSKIEDLATAIRNMETEISNAKHPPEKDWLLQKLQQLQ